MTHKPELLHVIEQNERDKDARCVRLVDSNGVFALVIDEKYGERFAALWNMAERLGLSTEEIEGIASDMKKRIEEKIDLELENEKNLKVEVKDNFNNWIELEENKKEENN